MDQDDILIQLVECVDFAAVKHRSQRRKDSEATPYINHPIGIKYFIISIKVSISRDRFLSALYRCC